VTEPLYLWTITDEVTKRRRQTRYRMSEQAARERHGDDAVKVDGSGITYTPASSAAHVQSGPRREREPGED
jgi:hypothetical protein